ncbi:HNH endonuclease signature motif containing protein [Hydrogenophaga sp. NH-16]|uniref:HNH endonuclease n=1 Tax=Hydrogenophaga sp. NH-16 TaxID=2184519 RepID=UPI000FD825B3|nr:HNH endonuclease signature motif containing protein [Hydrogenophaga sp. NH-16]
MDLVAEAGIDVSDWSNFRGGPSKARVNPKYCYEWAFDDGEKIVITLWHDELIRENGAIERRFNLNAHVKTEQNGNRKARRTRLRAALTHALNAKLPVRVIVVDGTRGALGKDTAKVKARLLDPAPWAVVHIRGDGEILLRRGMAAAPSVDQFSISELGSDEPNRRAVSGSVIARDGAVRRAVLDRSLGLCEYCKAPGFRTSGGQIYLETHHVVPLSEGGSDRPTNVIALCPNDHRKAHHSSKKDEIRMKLLKILESI